MVAAPILYYRCIESARHTQSSGSSHELESKSDGLSLGRDRFTDLLDLFADGLKFS
jgi:hypothetical protein